MTKTNIGLVDHAKKALDEEWRYVYATYGQVITQAVIDRAAARWTKQYTPEYKKETEEEASPLGTYRGADCVGLFKSYLWWVSDTRNPAYNVENDKSADGMFSFAKLNNLKHGSISTIPEVKGILVRAPGHVGIYIGDGWVIEDIGVYAHTVGGISYKHVCKTPLKGARNNPWTDWYYAPFISYEATAPTVPVIFDDPNKENVKWVQEHLIALGYDLGIYGADGDFGGYTLRAITKFQQEYGLPVTRIADLATITMLENPIKPAWKNPYPRPANTSITKKGMINVNVFWIQTVLKRYGMTIIIDGIFGSKTEALVKQFQSENGLKPDGIVGAKTLAVLDTFNH